MRNLSFLVLVIFSSVVFGGDKVENQEEKFFIDMPRDGLMSKISKWKQLYFVGITKGELDSISLNSQQFNGLLNMIGVHTYISTGLALDPNYAVNRTKDRVVTSWLNMFAVLANYQPELIDQVYEGKSTAFLPEHWSHGLFPKESGWPTSLVEKHDYDLKGYKIFIMPFLVPDITGNFNDLSQSIKSPDGSLEIFWFSYFDVNNPEKLLSDVSSLKNFILEERKELVLQ
ncbi:hypothetical protein [Shewanella woodyi]|uniref:hypothetical protein n=1 Tax=Shewanella woodyi TaxID=60961 RepID=UPI0007F8BDF3|nr:hypothetical protein [Shewanella woodyi]